MKDMDETYNYIIANRINKEQMVSMNIQVGREIKLVGQYLWLDQESWTAKDGEFSIQVHDSTLKCMEKLVKSLNCEPIQARNGMIDIILKTYEAQCD